jgi:hypothetical protein
VSVSFQYGTTTAYGLTAGRQSTGVSNAPTPFSAELTGLPAGTTIHYRAVAVSDFGTFVGGDQTLATISPSSPSPGLPIITVGQGKASVSAVKVSGSTASVRVSCTGTVGATCPIAFKLTVTERFKGHKLTSVSARSNGRATHRQVVVGTANASLEAGHAQTVRIPLNRAGKQLLISRHGLKATLRVTQPAAVGGAATILTATVAFKPARRRRAHR